MLVLCVAVAFAPVAGAAYKCVDEKGITHIGDTPPAACATVVMYEIKPNGSIVRKIDPTPTPEQAKALVMEQDRKREADKAAAEQKRKDAALLATFSSEKEFDVVLERSIAPIRSRMATASERIKAIEARQTKIEEEMEFYKAGKRKDAKGRDEAPPSLVAEQERLWHEKQSLVSGLASQEREIAQMQERFSSDKKRWVRIRGGGTGADVPVEAKAEAKPADTKQAAKKN
jgi:hypothetical protein